MSIFKKIKFVGVIVSIILASVYLTFLIDTYTLNTWLKRIFIFCYFVVVSCSAFYYYNKTKTRKFTLIPLLCAVAIVFLLQNTFLPTKEEHTIYIQSIEIEAGSNDEKQDEADDEERIKEAWLVDLEVDGQNTALSKLLINDNRQWSHADDYDDYFFRPAYGEKDPRDNLLSFTVVGNEIKLTFGANTWSGRVCIYYYENDGKTIAYSEEISLYNEDMENDRLDKTLNIEREYSIFERILYSAGAVVVLTFAFKVLFLAVLHSVDKKKSTKEKV